WEKQQHVQIIQFLSWTNECLYQYIYLSIAAKQHLTQVIVHLGSIGVTLDVHPIIQSYYHSQHYTNIYIYIHTHTHTHTHIHIHTQLIYSHNSHYQVNMILINQS
ncbi:unnamed protein product, partial [Sphagnum balticum]